MMKVNVRLSNLIAHWMLRSAKHLNLQFKKQQPSALLANENGIVFDHVNATLLAISAEIKHCNSGFVILTLTEICPRDIVVRDACHCSIIPDS